MITNQGTLFLIYVIVGLFIGFIFDLFRALRKSIKTSNIATYIEDIIFWMIVSFIVITTILKFNYGELRLYIFIGMILGGTTYILTISKKIVKLSTIIIEFIIKIIFKIKKILQKLLGKPIKLIIINFRKLPIKICQKLYKKRRNFSFFVE